MKKKLGISYNNDQVNSYIPVLELFQEYLSEELSKKFGENVEVSFLDLNNDLIINVYCTDQMDYRLSLSELHLLGNKVYWERLLDIFVRIKMEHNVERKKSIMQIPFWAIPSVDPRGQGMVLNIAEISEESTFPTKY